MNGGDNCNTKRARTSSSPIRPNEFHITYLPNGIFADIAAYLPKPSRVLFAIAMTTEIQLQSIETSLVSKTILSSTNWESLDFGDIESSLSNRLTDNDISNILICINAKSALKSLMLTGCININGSGLRPLRESTALERLDLSLVGYHENPEIEPPPKISESFVLPILDSIIEKQGNSLHYFQLSSKWREHQSPELAQTLEKFHLLMESRRIRCFKCDRHIEHAEGCKWYSTNNDDEQEDLYGLQNYTCCKCLKHFCYYHDDDEQEEHLKFCSSCTRKYCKSCSPTMDICAKCECCVCPTCEDLIECEDCSDLFCIDCAAIRDCCGERMCFTCKPVLICKGEECNNKLHCVDCFDGEEYDVTYCQECETEKCYNCRLLELRKDRITCNSDFCQSICNKGVKDRIVSENRGMRQFIKRQNAEIRRLRVMNKQKRSDLNMLRILNGKETLPESDQYSPGSEEESLNSTEEDVDHTTYICHKCGTGFCYIQFDNHEKRSRFCTHCAKDCCASCTPLEEWHTCSICDSQYICKECGNSSACSSCDKKACYLCSDTCPSCKLKRCSDCVGFLECYNCSKKHCAECYDGKENDVTHCDTCVRDYCQGCRKSCKVKEEKDACSGCGCVRKEKTY